MAITMTAGGSLNSVPAMNQQALTTNYIDFTATATAGWAQQYLPDLMEKEAEVFGNRTIGGFLEMVGAEEAMSADQVVWSEQGRLHISYQGNIQRSSPVATYNFIFVKDIDGNFVNGTASAAGASAVTDVAVRIGDLVILSDADKTVKGYVTAVGTTNVGSPAVAHASCTVQPLTDGGDTIDNVSASNSNVTCGLMVYGSEYAKGTTGRTTANKPQFKSFTNKPVIIKDMYEVSGSDASQIGWVEVTGEDGQNGYLWYLKAAGDTRARFTDYLEMVMVEHESATNTVTSHLSNTLTGSEGLFAAVKARGNAYDGLLAAATSVQALGDFDTILKEFDKQGAIEEYMVFADRDLMLTIDDMLGGLNPHSTGGLSFGVFDNSEDMALNLGFSGFRRGSYDFYKSDWKYLNDKATRGGIKDVDNHIRGIFIPAGTTTVYDQSLGKNLKRPFLHVRYRASNMEDRRFKTWTTGSVGAATSDLDAMEMHFLSERCLVTQGANNFMLIEATGTY
tara:strand:+ start:2238 stop:3758 length:1521 start_codon:yes stop_codon:yes gene_type:complete